MTQSKNSLSVDAIRLVHVMQMDRLALFALQQSFRQGQQRNEGRIESEDDKTFYECLNAVNPSIYTSIFADELVKQMSAEEIQQAVQFFERPTGKKIIQRGFIQLPYLFGVRTNDQLKDFSRNETAELEKCKKTKAGEKFLLQGIPNSEVVLNLLVAKNQEISQECARSADIPSIKG